MRATSLCENFILRRGCYQAQGFPAEKLCAIAGLKDIDWQSIEKFVPRDFLGQRALSTRSFPFIHPAIAYFPFRPFSCVERARRRLSLG